MKRLITPDDIQAAVWGGAILGGGGGGFPEAGERTARLALELGSVQLWSVDEFDPQAVAATVALVGAPAAPHPQVKPRDMIRTLELLRQALPAKQQPVAINTNENGAETTVNGWLHAAMTGLPVIDLACNGRAHPTSVMGSMGLNLDPGYQSYQAFAGGAPERYVEGVTSGRIDMASGVVRRASIEAGGLVGVARNPVTVDYAQRHGAPGAISFAIALGRAWLDGGVQAAAKHLGGRIVAEGTVGDYSCEQTEGLDLGHVKLDDAAQTTLRFVNEYMLLTQGGQRIASFPDLMMSFDEKGTPLVSAQIRPSQRIQVLVVPAKQLPLSRTMFMPALYAPLETLLGESFAPQPQN